MAPQRMRNALDDSRSESSSTREKQAGSGPNGISKGRRNGYSTLPGSNLKDVTNAQSTIGQQGPPDAAANIDWQSFDSSILHAYRHAHCLDVARAFSSSYNQRMLMRPGIGLLSPTMARQKDRRRVGKDQLAIAVRKGFNAASVTESELLTSFLYAVHNQDKSFRMRFKPTQAR